MRYIKVETFDYIVIVERNCGEKEIAMCNADELGELGFSIGELGVYDAVTFDNTTIIRVR